MLLVGRGTHPLSVNVPVEELDILQSRSLLSLYSVDQLQSNIANLREKFVEQQFLVKIPALNYLVIVFSLMLM